MLQLSFAPPQFKLRRTERGTELFDALRKKWLKLTPEEWVRQKLLQWFIQHHYVPSSFIALERRVQVGSLSRRFDVVIYNRNMQPWLLLECKAESVQLSEQVITQSLSYVSSIQSELFMISNGLHHYAWQRRDDGTALMLDHLPAFPA